MPTNNTYEKGPLQSILADVFAIAIADELDKLISGYVFKWDYQNNCFSVQKLVRSYYSIIVVLVFCYDTLEAYYYNTNREIKIIDDWHCNKYDLTDPANSIEVIVGDLVRIVKLNG